MIEAAQAQTIPAPRQPAGSSGASDGARGPQNENHAPVLLHGWPYDIHSYVDVAPLLASVGYRVIVPYLRGYGTTRFLSSETFRNAQQSVVALDVIALMDALKIEKATVGGFDWGARTACIIAALWPERCKAIVSVSGYLITISRQTYEPLPPKGELGWWYQYYFAIERGRLGYDRKPARFQRSLCGKSLRRNGISTMPRSSAPRRPSTTPITSAS